MQPYPGMPGAPVMQGTPNMPNMPGLQLGPQVAQYKGAFVNNTILGVVCFIIGAFLLFASTAPSGGVGVAVAGVLFIVGALAAFFLVIRSFGKLITVYQGGLTIKRGSSAEAIPWDDITGYFINVTRTRSYGIPVYTTRIYTITRRSGQRIAIRGYQQIEQLANIIERETANRLYPQMAAAYRMGQPIPFGPFTISQAGIAKGAEMAPWNTITNVRVANGIFSVHRQGKMLGWTARVPQLPNLVATLTLINNIRSGRV